MQEDWLYLFITHTLHYNYLQIALDVKLIYMCMEWFAWSMCTQNIIAFVHSLQLYTAYNNNNGCRYDTNAQLMACLDDLYYVIDEKFNSYWRWRVYVKLARVLFTH